MAFWREKTLEQMTPQEWESLCDGCGQCCLHKLENEDTGEYYYTEVACELLDIDCARCSNYKLRKKYVPECLKLSVEDVENFHWLPSNCAYRLLADGEPLPSWHPLISGNRQSVIDAGQSVIGRVISESEVAEEDLEEHIIYWVE